MTKLLPRCFLFCLFTTVIAISAISQKVQYKLNSDRSSVSMQIDQKHLRSTLDKIRNSQIAAPYPEAQLYYLGFNMDTVGLWSVSEDNENIWKLSIQIPGSKSSTLAFSDFYLPRGSRLFVYPKGKFSDVVIYMHEDNPNGGAYSLENVKGECVVLEYIADSRIKDKPRLQFYDLGYKFSNLERSVYASNDFRINECIMNVNCPEAAKWQNQKKGVVKLRTRRIGTSIASLCSGTLINNTKDDKTPYVLTAYHCFEHMTTEDISGTEFFFEYESPGCESVESAYKFLKGAKPIVISPLQEGSDAALLELTAKIPSDWDVYYNGWSRENDGKKIFLGASIHHPKGDIKKISLYENSLYSTNWTGPGASLHENTHWRVSYSSGVTDEGSSGSPLFNSKGLIVGTLTGGSSSCSSPTMPDYYGKFWYHWDQGEKEEYHLSKYLDPKQKGVREWSGIASEPKDPNPLPDNQPLVYAFFDYNNLEVITKSPLTKIRVVDMDGNYIYSTTTFDEDKRHIIETSNWRTGVYIISVDMKDNVSKSIKVLKSELLQNGKK